MKIKKIKVQLLKLIKKIFNKFGYDILIVSINRDDANLTIDGNIEMAKFFNITEYLKFKRKMLNN